MTNIILCTVQLSCLYLLALCSGEEIMSLNSTAETAGNGVPFFTSQSIEEETPIRAENFQKVIIEEGQDKRGLKKKKNKKCSKVCNFPKTRAHFQKCIIQPKSGKNKCLPKLKKINVCQGCLNPKGLPKQFKCYKNRCWPRNNQGTSKGRNKCLSKSGQNCKFKQCCWNNNLFCELKCTKGGCNERNRVPLCLKPNQFDCLFVKGSECEAQNDCCPNLKCVSKASGQGKVCKNCLLRPGTQCSNKNKCCKPLVCDSGICYPEKCITNRDCGDGTNTCAKGQCFPTRRNDGQSCDEPLDCESRICRRGVCEEECGNNSDCSTNVCVISKCVPKLQPLGGSCDEDNDCEIGICRADICERECKFNTDCDDNCVNGKCYKGKHSNGARCDEDSDCLSGYCLYDECRDCFHGRQDLLDAIGSYLLDGSSSSAAKLYGYPIGNWCVKKVTDMSELFMERGTFNEDISGWDVGDVTDMTNMFSKASAFNQDIGGWKVASVQRTGFMFYEASSFNQDLSGWDISKAKNTDSMFSGARSFNCTNGPISGPNVLFSQACTGNKVAVGGRCDNDSDCFNGACGKTCYQCDYICCASGSYTYFFALGWYCDTGNKVAVGGRCENDSDCFNGACGKTCYQCSYKCCASGSTTYFFAKGWYCD